MAMTYQEVALELVKIARQKFDGKQDDVIDLYITFLNKLNKNEEQDLN